MMCQRLLKAVGTTELPQFPNVSQAPSPPSYEAFLLCAQPPWVDCTLPQASADISKTGSNRKEGVVYGFFAGAGAVSRILSLVD
jgi:hypothetical protein